MCLTTPMHSNLPLLYDGTLFHARKKLAVWAICGGKHLSQGLAVHRKPVYRILFHRLDSIKTRHPKNNLRLPVIVEGILPADTPQILEFWKEVKCLSRFRN